MSKRILFLTKKVPYPSIDGECLVIKQDIQMCLDSSQEIYLLSLNTDKHYVSTEEIKRHIPSKVHLEWVDIRTEISLSGVLGNIFSSIPYNIERFYNTTFLEKIKAFIQQFKIDIIFFEGLHLAVYAEAIRKEFNVSCVMRSHNVESEIWARRSQQENNVLKKWYLSFLSRKVKKFETKTYSWFDSFIAISKRDLAIHESHGLVQRTFVIPFSIQEIVSLNNTNKERAIFFLGSFDWEPNRYGIGWFIENVWKTFHQQHPDWALYLAGRNFPQEDHRFNAPGIKILGEVEDASSLFNRFETMIVPLFSGSGIRIKIIEAMSAGCVIVSTSIGAEGIYHDDLSGIKIAKDATQFLHALELLQADSVLCKKLGENNRQEVLRSFYYNNLLIEWRRVLEN